ncbi:hypothetical protein P43SY_004817 [Pythium insidiosum]|uniref:TIGR01456 family HAD hydrolase n=1 Tax=Pythium insidiosum TaxID=114742 RepID=A0AAD5Q8H6_PYTIN|nr:hypothetical protein P43SY_004817 [Pythium insidiosum]
MHLATRRPLCLSTRWLRAARASFSSASTGPSFGIAFDIDGVLVRGGKELPRARDIILRLREDNVPHIFLTNGGGCMEAEKAANLGRALDLEIAPQQMVLSHTPMRELVDKFKDSRVLIMGSYDVYTVAREYGFNKVVSVNDLAQHYPTLYPFHKYEHKPAPYHGEPIEAIIIMHDPIDWAPEIQVAVDVLIGGDPPGSGRPCGTQTPLFVSNDDFVFSGAYPHPRFAQGAFTRCLQLLYETHTGKSLEVTRYGKPHGVTYSFAEDLLNTLAGRSNTNRIKSIYGIGDNPLADIQGANNAGAHWSSVLVRTGIYDGSKEPEHIPDVYAHDVHDAIERIYEAEGMKL